MGKKLKIVAGIINKVKTCINKLDYIVITDGRNNSVTV